jgi:hypothetical protein
MPTNATTYCNIVLFELARLPEHVELQRNFRQSTANEYSPDLSFFLHVMTELKAAK